MNNKFASSFLIIFWALSIVQIGLNLASQSSIRGEIDTLSLPDPYLKDLIVRYEFYVENLYNENVQNHRQYYQEYSEFFENQLSTNFVQLTEALCDPSNEKWLFRFLKSALKDKDNSNEEFAVMIAKVWICNQASRNLKEYTDEIMIRRIKFGLEQLHFFKEISAEEKSTFNSILENY
jgi:hypothetical protein